MRCFVACWPDPATRTRLDHVAQGLHARYPGSRRMLADNLHLTLAFIGELPHAMASEVASAMADLSVAPFAWCVDRLGQFDRARLVWAGGPEQPRLAELAERARDRLRTLDVQFDRKPFAAHVTLLRDVPARAPALERPENPALEPIPWPIEAARLVVSERDGRGAARYHVLQPA
jgi:RNA 2',3'-cyclic 3'-phosphodiesterase